MRVLSLSIFCFLARECRNLQNPTTTTTSIPPSTAPTMARGRQSTSGSSALLAAQRVIDSEDTYRSSVRRLHATSKILAKYLAPVDGDLRNVSEGDDNIENCFEECRIRLKGISDGNVKKMKEIDYFVEAVRDVKNDMTRRQQDESEDDAVDYEAAIHSAVERIREKDAITPDQIDHDPMVIELRTTLGEKVKSDDDDLEIMNNRDETHALKCPITATFFEDPVKNKVCGHTYSKSGLQQMLKNRKRGCPVAGCSNNNLGLAQVEPDDEMRMRVNRLRKREEQAKKKRALEDEADEEEMGENGGFTMIQ